MFNGMEGVLGEGGRGRGVAALLEFGVFRREGLLGADGSP